MSYEYELQIITIPIGVNNVQTDAREVAALVRGPLGVNQSGDLFTVTHVQTGRCIITNMPDLKTALKAMNALLQIDIPWHDIMTATEKQRRQLKEVADIYQKCAVQRAAEVA